MFGRIAVARRVQDVLSREQFATMISKAYTPTPKVEQIYEVADIKSVLVSRLRSRLANTRPVHTFAFVHQPKKAPTDPLRAGALHKEWCTSPKWLGDEKQPDHCMMMFLPGRVPSAADLVHEVGPTVYKPLNGGSEYYTKLVNGLEVSDHIISYHII